MAFSILTLVVEHATHSIITPPPPPWTPFAQSTEINPPTQSTSPRSKSPLGHSARRYGAISPALLTCEHGRVQPSNRAARNSIIAVPVEMLAGQAANMRPPMTPTAYFVCHRSCVSILITRSAVRCGRATAITTTAALKLQHGLALALSATCG